MENGNVLCKGGEVNMMGIMEKMKIAFHSATTKDFMSFKEKLFGSNFSWNSATSPEVPFIKHFKYTFVETRKFHGHFLAKARKLQALFLT